MPTLRIIPTTHEIRTLAAEWDDLWRRSGVGLPTKRATLLAQWLDHFAPRGAFTALVVEERGKLLAALPLISRRLGRTLPAATLPVNCWSSAGDLLLDEECDQESVLECLIAGVRRLPWPLLWFDTIEIDQPQWIAWQTACRRAGLPILHRSQFNVGLVDVGGDWTTYRDRWSRNHRRDIERRLRKAQGQGELRLDVHDHVAVEEVEPLLVRGLEVEDRSWKGPAGTSVLRSPGMFDFYLAQARQLAERGQLRISLLTLEGWPIAFEYGYEAAGTYFSHKVGYDEAYRDLAPGQLLMMLLLERDHRAGGVRLHHCMGMLTGAVAKWCTRVRPLGRLVVGTGGPVGAASLLAYRTLWPLVRGAGRAIGRGGEAPRTFTLGCAPARERQPLPLLARGDE